MGGARLRGRLVVTSPLRDGLETVRWRVVLLRDKGV